MGGGAAAQPGGPRDFVAWDVQELVRGEVPVDTVVRRRRPSFPGSSASRSRAEGVLYVLALLHTGNSRAGRARGFLDDGFTSRFNVGIRDSGSVLVPRVVIGVGAWAAR
jgi:hypothetical protein